MANGVRKSSLVREIKRVERRVSAQELLRAWGAGRAARLSVWAVDSHYFALPAKTWDRVIQYTGVDAGRYEPERYDCDDFAVAFKAAVSRKLKVNGVGYVIDVSGGHAYNALLVADGDGVAVSFLEPQNDRLVMQPAPQYAMQSGAVLF